MRFFLPVPAARAVERTPPDRDRVVDLVRAASLMVVVAGHCIMAVVAWRQGVPRLGNLLGAYPVTQLVTWLLQVMPLFFWAGGAANAISWQRHRARGDGAVSWLWGRAQRLLRPLWAYIAVMAVIAAIVTALAPTAVAEPLLLLTTQLLWFLGAYLMVTALTPWFRATSASSAVTGTALLLAAVALVDIVRFTMLGPAPVALLNFVLVWAVPAWLGALRAQGALAALRPSRCIAIATVAMACNALLIAIGPYPLSMVGMPGDPVSNMAPPSLVMALHAIALAMLVTAGDAQLQRLAQRPRVWRTATAVNLSAMTLYLWHLPVLVALTTLAHAVGLDRAVRLDRDGQPVPDGWPYLLGSLPFAFAFALAVWATIRLLWPLEHAPLPWWDAPSRCAAPSRSAARAGAWLGCVGVGVATLALSATGLGGFPTRVVHYAGVPLTAAAAMLLLLVSGALLRWAGADRV